MFDAVIVGGGLAGCSAAVTLAERGYCVALLEAKNYPRHRVCGEFLSPECVDTLETLGTMEAIREHSPTWMTHTRITTPSGSTWERDLPGTAMGVSRYVLDDLLAKRAISTGADLRIHHTVTGITGNLTEGFTVQVRGHEPIQAKTVIGAHGKRANLDRALNRRFLKRKQPYIGLKMHFRADPVPARVELHTFEGGYCGLSEVENGVVNACLLAREDVFRAAGSIPAFVNWMGEQNPALHHWLKTATPLLNQWISISQVPFINKKIVENDILMTGDAAGLIAPLAGNGMGMALDGGMLAANHVHRYLRGERSAGQLMYDYTAAWQTQFGGRLRTGRFLQACLLRPALLDIGLGVVNRLPALGDFFIRQTRDTR